jgi:transposase
LRIRADAVTLSEKEITMARPKPALTLTDDERRKLTLWANRPKSSQRLALRARIVLACANEPSNKAVAATLEVCNATVGTWRNRFLANRLDGLTDDPRPGAPRTVTDAHVEDIVTRTLESKPANATHWSTRTLAKTTGMSQSAISRIWRAFGLKPHLHETFKLSTDPYFVEKVRDVVGLYLSPPENAIVLSVDEKSQVQALDRTQPILPMTPGQVERGTHDYVRHGVTSLFAALNVATGQVIGTCHRRHRHQEFLKFLDHVDATLVREPGVSVHIILDNYATHKTPAVKRWFLRHPEYQLHFIPTSSSWLNQVERFFAEITEKRIRRGAFRSIASLEKAIADYLAAHNAAPKPFTWVADADAILDRIKKVCERTSDSGH